MTGNELYEEYCNEYPLIMGYREVSYESWLQRQVLELRENVVNKNCNTPRVGNCPSELEPVLAKIEHINSLGKSSWYEVVYFDGHWRCYAGSNTFKDGEKVVKWRYCKDCC